MIADMHEPTDNTPHAQLPRPPLLVTFPQAAGLLAVSRSTVYQLIWDDELAPIRIGPPSTTSRTTSNASGQPERVGTGSVVVAVRVMRGARIEQQERLLAHLARSLAFMLHVAPGRRDVRVADELGPLAEVDGNRTRRMGIAHPNRFEGGGAHQVLGHLRRRH